MISPRIIPISAEWPNSLIVIHLLSFVFQRIRGLSLTIILCGNVTTGGFLGRKKMPRR